MDVIPPPRKFSFPESTYTRIARISDNIWLQWKNPFVCWAISFANMMNIRRDWPSIELQMICWSGVRCERLIDVN